jgi:hypothetical protein
MENKITTIKILVVLVTIICGGIICINTILHSEAKQNVIGYEKMKPVNLTPVGDGYEEWVDNFDTSYVDNTTGCIVYTRK